MAEIAGGEKSLLTSKWGPLPVWAWGGIGLVAAWLFAKWRDSKSSTKDTSSQDSADTADTSESEAVAPQFIIENNMPATPVGAGAPTTPSAPVVSTQPAPVVTPPKTSPNPPTTKPPATSKPPATTKKKAPLKYTVKHGDTLSAIAKKYHTTASALFTYNTTSGNRPAATIRTLKERGPNLLYAGETILIPQK